MARAHIRASEKRSVAEFGNDLTPRPKFGLRATRMAINRKAHMRVWHKRLMADAATAMLVRGLGTPGASVPR